MKTEGFVHLHNHTEHSAQDGLQRLGDLFAHVADLDQPVKAVALTDHGSLSGIHRAAELATKHGVTLIPGMEAYVALTPPEDFEATVPDPDAPKAFIPDPAGTRLEWDDPRVRFLHIERQGVDAESGKAKSVSNHHLTLLALGHVGWRKLVAIHNAAEDSMYYKPLADYALLARYATATWIDGEKRFEFTSPSERVPDDPWGWSSTEGDLICLSGCLGGPVASHVAAARSVDDEGNASWDEAELEAARTELSRLIAIFGSANTYVEIMEHGLRAEGVEHMKMLCRLADDAGVKVVVTNDGHFIHEHEADAHDSWLVAGEQFREKNPERRIDKHTPGRWKFNGHGYWLRSEDEMRAISAGCRWQEACSESVAIARRVVKAQERDGGPLPRVELRLPKFNVPDTYVDEWTTKHGPSSRYPTPADWMLHRMVVEGAKARLGGPLTEEVRGRIVFEEESIFSKGISDYFLIVGDILDWARSSRGVPTAQHPRGLEDGKKPIIVGPGRGSAGGSYVSYALRITQIDPLRHNLPYERFLSPDRLNMPDIDVDFESLRRGEIYLYAAAVYGYDFVARLGSYSGMMSRRAVKDAARVLALGKVGDELSNLIPVVQGKPIPLTKMDDPEFAPGSPWRDRIAKDSKAAECATLARSLENLVGGYGIHAAGLVIGDEPLTTIVPMRRDREKNAPEGALRVTTWDGVDMDHFGSLKLDALAILNLDYVARAAEFIQQRHGVHIDTVGYDFPDPDDISNPTVRKTYDLLRSGKTAGVFQLESGGMTSLAMALGPRCYADMSALVALYRPGPMGSGMHHEFARRRNGASDVTYDYLTSVKTEQDVIAQVLDPFFGLIFYQEAMMRLSGSVAGFTPGQRDALRSAIGKKKRKDIDVLQPIFLDGGLGGFGDAGVKFSRKTLENLWQTFESSAEYAFNQAHSVAYGYLGYVTAWLRANYPVEFGAAILAVVANDPQKASKRDAALFSLLNDGIVVSAPDVNRSEFDAAPVGEGVVLGIRGIKDVGKAAADVIAAREAGGPFTSFHDLATRSKVNSTVLRGLIESGACDAFGDRLALLRIVKAPHAPMVDDGRRFSLLESARRQLLRIGLSFGSHPADVYADDVEDTINEVWRAKNVVPLSQVPEHDEEYVETWGVITSWETKASKKGNTYHKFTLSTSGASVEGIAFGSTKFITADGDRTGIPEVGALVALNAEVEVSVSEATDDSEEETVAEPVTSVKASRFLVFRHPPLLAA